MNTKLTLRMDENTVQKAKLEAKLRGKSVSRMISDFIESIDTKKTSEKKLPPVTSKLAGILKGKDISEEEYKAHLMEKYL
ncbi:MAG: antitoxin [Deltaproteobacteria bacterium]|nr:antitoxin [Deltaproteobacteria bacterium]